MTNTNPLTINGTGIGGAGALINSSAANATYPGLLKLGSTSSIVSSPGSIILSNSGTIIGPTSGTFGLTLDGTAAGSSIASIIGQSSGAVTTVTKNGTGTWDFTAVAASTSAFNTYTGGTTINAGTLDWI